MAILTNYDQSASLILEIKILAYFVHFITFNLHTIGQVIILTYVKEIIFPIFRSHYKAGKPHFLYFPKVTIESKYLLLSRRNAIRLVQESLFQLTR